MLTKKFENFTASSIKVPKPFRERQRERMEDLIASFKELTAAEQKKAFKQINEIMEGKPKRVRKVKSDADGSDADKEKKEPSDWIKLVNSVREEHLIKNEKGEPVLKDGKPTYSISYKEAMSLASARKAAADPEFAAKKDAMKTKYKEKSETTKEKKKSNKKVKSTIDKAFAESEPEPSETEASDSGLPKASKPKVKKVTKLAKVKEGKTE
jgi:hypothetical protein